MKLENKEQEFYDTAIKFLNQLDTPELTEMKNSLTEYYMVFGADEQYNLKHQKYLNACEEHIKKLET